MDSCTKIDEINKWLKDHKRTKKWLADQLKVHDTTVRKWLSGLTPLPESRLAFINAVMGSPHCDDEEVDGVIKLAINFSEEEMAVIKAAATLQGISPQQYVQNTAVALAEELADVLLHKMNHKK